MDKRPPRPMTPFDEFVSSPQLQTIKLLLPYAPAPGQRLLAAFIKFFELRRAILLFSRPSSYNSSKFFFRKQQRIRGISGQLKALPGSPGIRDARYGTEYEGYHGNGSDDAGQFRRQSCF